VNFRDILPWENRKELGLQVPIRGVPLSSVFSFHLLQVDLLAPDGFRFQPGQFPTPLLPARSPPLAPTPNSASSMSSASANNVRGSRVTIPIAQHPAQLAEVGFRASLHSPKTRSLPFVRHL
jgi:hypothetical protein